MGLEARRKTKGKRMTTKKPDIFPPGKPPSSSNESAVSDLPLPKCPHCARLIERDSLLYERIKSEVLLDVIMKRAENAD